VSEQVGDWNWANVQSAADVVCVGRSAVFLRERPPRSPGLELPRHLAALAGHASTRRVRVDGPSGSGRVERLDQGPRRHIDHEALRFSRPPPVCQRRCPDGELRVAMLDREAAVIEPYDERACLQSAETAPARA